jgi:hypothetical protein
MKVNPGCNTSRSTSLNDVRHIGLNDRGLKIAHSAIRSEPYKEVGGWTLYDHVLPDGRKVRELVQFGHLATLFTALTEGSEWIEETKWTNEEVAERMR